MRHHRLGTLAVAGSALAALVGLAGPAAATPAATHSPAAPTTHRVTSTRTGQVILPASDHPTLPAPVKETMGVTKKASGLSPAIEFTCTTEYGVRSMVPVSNSTGGVAYYVLDYYENNECDLPLYSNIQIEVIDTSTSPNQVEDTTPAQDFDVTNSAENNTVQLPVENDFVGQFHIGLTLEPGFIWVWTTDPAHCLGIGSASLVCVNQQAISTKTSAAAGRS